MRVSDRGSLRPALAEMNPVVNGASLEVASMGDPDETIREALKKARALLAQYIEPDGPNEHQTVKQLFGILNDPAVSQALQQAEQPVRNRKRRQQLGDAA